MKSGERKEMDRDMYEGRGSGRERVCPIVYQDYNYVR